MMVLGLSELYDNANGLEGSAYREIIKVPFYHYVYKQHAALVAPINDALVKYKQTPQFQAMKSRYWVK